MKDERLRSFVMFAKLLNKFNLHIYIIGLILTTSSTAFSASPVAGSGNALTFDGQNDYVRIADGCMVDDAWTIEFWIYAFDPPPSDYQRIFIQGAGACYPRQIMAYWYQYHVEFYTATNNGAVTAAIASNNIPTEAWCHIAWTFNGSTHRVYINGERSSKNPNGGSPSSLPGNSYIGVERGNSYYWKGNLDEIRVWDRARDQEAIAADRFTALSGNEPGLKAYWRMDQASGSHLPDWAGGSFDGTLNNMSTSSWVASDVIWKNRSTFDRKPLVHSGGYDPDGDPLTGSLVSGPSKGTVTFHGNLVTYTPEVGSSGTFTYSYRMSDASNSDTYDMRVTVEKNTNYPLITSQPKSDSVDFGGSFDIFVTADGQNPLYYQWYKLNNTVWDEIPGETNAIYSVNNVTQTDAGKYRVTVTNSLATITSEIAEITVVNINLITKDPVNDTVVVGSDASFAVEAQGPNLTYQWQKNDGTNIFDIPNATASVYTFAPNLGDDQTQYRCVVTSNGASDYSLWATLFVGELPVFTSLLPTDTVIATGDPFSFTVTANSATAPSFAWYYYDSLSTDTLPVSSTATLQYSTLSKQEHGYYFVTAANMYGMVTSPASFLHVINPISIVIDLPLQYQAMDGGVANLSPDISGEGQIFYQWYENGALVPNETKSKLIIDPVDFTIHDRNTYYCEMWNTYLNIHISAKQTRLCTLTVSKFYNPFKVKVERLNDTNTSEVRMKIWSTVDLANFPSQPSSTNPWADSLIVMYKTKGFANSPLEARTTVVLIDNIKAVAPDTLEEIHPVAPLPIPHDSSYWFNYSVIWHDKNIPIDSLLEPYIESNKVFMLDTSSPPNPLSLQGQYVENSDSALIFIDGITGLNQQEDSLVFIQCSKYPTYNPLFYDKPESVPDLISGGPNDTITLTGLGTPPFEEHTIYCRWFVMRKNSITGKQLHTQFLVGSPRPQYSGTLVAEKTSIGGELLVTWDAPSSPVDSIRIWWDIDTLPLDYTFPLPLAQVVDFNPNSVIDTIRNLDNNKTYCLGLQIYRNGMWSRVTEKSRTWATTAPGDSLQVDNIIAIDSSWFHDTSNSIVIRWHIDTLSPAPGKYYKFGYLSLLDSFAVVDTNQSISNWREVENKQNETKISLHQNIVFDTSFYVGLWLRSHSDISGPGKKSPPTDSSLVKVRVPSFTWQILAFFSDTADTVFAVNKKIILTKIMHFEETDTIWAFHLPSLPYGFVEVGGINFSFSSKNLQVPKFIIGLAYDNLPVGVSPNDLAMYQFKEEKLHVRHASWVDNGVVWDTVNHKELVYPFLVLADTTTPIISTLPYEEIVLPGKEISTQFNIKDNVANTYYQFIYGAGNEIYAYGMSDTLSVCSTSTPINEFIIDQSNTIINPSFGVRALVIASDGVNADTVNVSRRVATDNAGSYVLNAQQWFPLRAKADLDKSALEDVFTNSSGPNEPLWEYDIYKQRIYRWHNTDARAQNKWLEYNDTLTQAFSLQAGRLLWCKTATAQRVKFGPGVTTSLKNPYSIELKPKNCTDFSLPFKFPIMLRDILEASGKLAIDSLEVYIWKKSGLQYESDYIYLPPFDSIVNETDTLKDKQHYDGYTIYNMSSKPINLNIPPTCLALSKYSKPLKRIPDKDLWKVIFKWRRNDELDDSYFRQLPCGYRSTGENTIFFGSLPPSMSEYQVGIHHKETNELAYWALQAGEEFVGAAFEIVFKNRSNKKIIFDYFVDNLGTLPSPYKAQVLDPDTYTYSECKENSIRQIAVNAGASKSRLLAIGDTEYFSNLLTTLLPLKLVKVYPNPFQGVMQIHYRIPRGIKEVSFTLFNLHGQKVWQGVDRKNIGAGNHYFRFDSRLIQQNSSLSSGVYVLHLTAKTDNGKRLYGGNTRIINMR